MSVLKDPKREAFAQGLAKGFSASQSYEDAGYRPHRQNAARLARRDDIRARVDDIRANFERLDKEAEAKTLKKLEISKERVLSELAKIGFANLGDYFRVTDDGDPQIALHQATRDQLAALSEIQTETTISGSDGEERVTKKVKIKLWDKKGALVDLGKHLGMFVQGVTIGDLMVERIFFARSDPK